MEIDEEKRKKLNSVIANKRIISKAIKLYKSMCPKCQIKLADIIRNCNASHIDNKVLATETQIRSACEHDLCEHCKLKYDALRDSK
jgi:hypothetical protein